MFGHQDNQDANKSDDQPVEQRPVVNDVSGPAPGDLSISTTPSSHNPLPSDTVSPTPTAPAAVPPSESPVEPTPDTTQSTDGSAPANDDTSGAIDASDIPSIRGHHEDEKAGSDGPGSDLLDLKKEALQQLSPLVHNLDQTPEEKFQTFMMMIQAADNQSLIKEAFTAAQAITDEKKRAQALLDVVNEINYFTQQKSS